MKIGERIKQARDERGVTAEHLAVAINRGSQTIFRWEWGEVSPRINDLADIANGLGISLGVLLKGVDDDHPARARERREAEKSTARKPKPSKKRRAA